jgi:soluble P-type ATPase
MITIAIPTVKTYSLAHLVLDLNGTLCCDGLLIDGIVPKLKELSTNISIHVLTADTYGLGISQTKQFECITKILETDNHSQEKDAYVTHLNASQCVCIGNGYNDHLMVQSAAIGIAVIQCEGAAVQTLLNADIACPDIETALDLLIVPKKLIATLRN